jgi:uncharacterized membrane protein YfhO
LQAAAGELTNPAGAFLFIENREPLSQLCRSTDSAAVQLRQERPDQVILQTSQSEPGWVFLADTWYPGWQVQIDGKPGHLLRANYLFMAVQVPAGNHQVIFSYDPSIFIIGLSISVTGWLIVIASIIIFKVKIRASSSR